MKRLLAIIFASSFALQLLHAQSNSFFIGVNGGANFSKFKYTVDLAELYPTSTSLPGLNGGLVAGLRLNNFTITSGAQYIQKGGHYATENFVDQGGTGFLAADEKLHFVSIPVLLGYEKNLGYNFGISLAMGPSFNIGLTGKIDESIEYYGSDDISVEHYTAKFGSSVNDDYRKTQVGFQFSPGLFFDINERSRITMGVTWDSGMNDNYNPRYKEANTFFEDYRGNQFSRSTILTIGYQYHISFGDRY